MMPVFSTCLRIVGGALLVRVVLAQQCYYPNGAKAEEKPCSSAAGSACCPDKWQCLDNGLCYYPPDKLHGRYSCTDKDWKSPGCASNMCTYGLTVAGGESITQCSNHNNQWCCNGDATNVHCCDEKPVPRPFFKLQDGKPYATIGGSIPSSGPTLASITGLATSGGSSSPSSTSISSFPPSSSVSSASSSSSAPPSSSSTTMTSLSTRTSTGSSGPTTITESRTITADINTATNTPAPIEGDKKSKVPLIVGCAVGIPLAIAFIGIMLWLLRKRSQQKKSPYSDTSDPYANGALTPEFAGGATFSGGNKLHKATNGATTSEKLASPAGVPELESQSVGPERPVSMVPGSAELDSGGKFAPGTVPHAPHLVGVGGGNGLGHHGQGGGVEEPSPTMSASWGSAPPGYSPGMNQSHWAPGHAQQSSTGSFDGSGAGAGGYLPYRPPAGHEAYAHHGTAGGLANVPEVAELSAVESPPTIVDARNGHPLPPPAAEPGTVQPPPPETGAGTSRPT
ncbi:hypothetical protein P280DRAFT_81296 [Massarina eburnea CBS 473.64]|uniref:Mid2 domain-containing protein n=1 Tax=Massarina eburnea CBS 473.64 TaxID=1395130 RepID=A0A6A6RSI0_9PLEO|nr:hypothetical protein P280DRAFT_81296 [Massarina eburnea CBS 473.64]